MSFNKTEQYLEIGRQLIKTIEWYNSVEQNSENIPFTLGHIKLRALTEDILSRVF